MPKNYYLNLLIVGELNRDFIIDLSGKPTNDLPGGSLLNAAAGARVWSENIGLVSRIGDDFPSEWIDAFEKRGFDTRGIWLLPQNFDVRRFYFWQDPNHCITDSPVASYSHSGLPFPHNLLGYSSVFTEATEKMWRNITPHLNPTFPPEFLDSHAVHICPINLISQIKLTAFFQHASINTITVSPSDDYMNPGYFEQLPAVIKGITAFFPSELQLGTLFQGRAKDVWEMAEGLAEAGCPLTVIQRGEKGYWMYDAANRLKFSLPFYPTRWLNPTGINDVFAGAFLGEYKKNYDPIHALLAGAATASVAVEGVGPFYCLDGFPDIASARREVLASMLKRI